MRIEAPEWYPIHKKKGNEELNNGMHMSKTKIHDVNEWIIPRKTTKNKNIACDRKGKGKTSYCDVLSNDKDDNSSGVDFNQ